MKTITSRIIKKIANQCGADLCGIASVQRFKQAPRGFHPKDIYPATRSVIAFARRIPDSAFASDTPVPYTFLTTLVLNEVYQLTLRIVRELENMGVTGVPVPSKPYEYWDKNSKTGKGGENRGGDSVLISNLSPGRSDSSEALPLPSLRNFLRTLR